MMPDGRPRGVTAVLLAAVLLGTGAPVSEGAGAPCTLRELAAATHVTLGAGFVEGSHQEAFRETLAREYSGVTVPLYWSQSEPTPGAFDFTAADAAVAVGEAGGLRMRGHPLVWGRLALPAWVTTSVSADELRAAMARHIRTIMERYRGRIVAYDVVNEPVTYFGAPGTTDGLDPNVFLELLGPGYIREALEIAHEADPEARLFVNDFLLLGPGAKQDRFYDLVRGLVEEGAPIHGVGLQGHVRLPLWPDFAPSRAEMDEAIARFAGLGLAVEVTELDVVVADRSACELGDQRRVYRDVLAACVGNSACSGVTTWGITDAFTWVKGFFGVDGAPLPFDETYARKPAWFGIRDALAQVACPGSACPTGCALDACEGVGCAVCDDGDPCTIDTCDPVEGCLATDVTGIEAAACVCTRNLPDECAATPLPPKADRALARACEHLDAAASASDRAQRRFAGKASRRFRAAGRAVRRAEARGTLPTRCASPLGAFLDDGRARARAARLGQP